MWVLIYVSRCSRIYFGRAMPRRGSYFFLLAQEKCNQKEGHPGSPVALLGDSPALLAAPGG
jgi:hypothetical protein